VTSLVENQAEDNVGQFVTIQFNLLDSDGEILASTEQVEAFSRADQKLAVGTQVDIPDRGKVPKWRPPWRSAITRTSMLSRFPRSLPGK
jgi:hypothetical protein